MSSSYSPPPAPNYAAAATAQGVANRETAITQGHINNPNMRTPYGSSTTTWDMTDPNNPQPTINQTLSPDQQQILDAQNHLSIGMLNTGQDQLGRVSATLGTAYNPNTPDLTYGVAPVDYQNNVQGGPIQSGYDMGPSVQTDLGNSDYGKQMDEVTNAYMSRINPQFDMQTHNKENELVNQGIQPGTEAYNAAMTPINMARNDATQQAYLAGSQLQNQFFGQGLQAGQFGNQAQNQINSQNQGAANFYNQAQGTQFGQGAQNAQLYNTANQNIFSNQMQNASMGNQAIGQGIQQYLTQRELPINEINALRSGSQVQNPQFNSWQGSTVAPPPIFQGAQAQGQYQQNAYNQQSANANNFTSGLMNMGASALPYLAMSDIRLKSNIVKVGDHPLGIGIYEYDIFGHRERGVIAQELERVMPEAVFEHPSGYKMVDYGRIW